MAIKKKKIKGTIWKFCIIFFALGAVVMFIDNSIMEGFVYLLLFVISIGAYKSTKAKNIKSKSSEKRPIKKVEHSPTKHSDQEDTDSISKALENSIPDKTFQPISINVDTPRTSITEKHHITGISHYMDNLMHLAGENYEYDYSKRELIDNMLEGERIYQYEFEISKAELIEEPTNPYDPNAVKVVLDGLHVGYIKKGSCAHIKKLLSSNRIIGISAKVGGGKYKFLSCEYDYEKDKDVYELERDSTNFFVDIILELKETK